MSGNRGVISLMEHVGEENIMFQFLHRSATNISAKKGYTSVTFDTDSSNITPADLMPGAKPKKVALVVWVDSDRVDQWRNK